MDPHLSISQAQFTSYFLLLSKGGTRSQYLIYAIEFR